MHSRYKKPTRKVTPRWLEELRAKRRARVERERIDREWLAEVELLDGPQK